MRSSVALICLWLVSAGSAPVASAQPACPVRPQSAALAKQLASTWWRFGVSFFEAKNYTKAIHAWLCANKLAPHPLAFYNIGRAADRAGDPRMAVRFYQRFLKARPQTPKRAEVERRIRALTASPRRAHAHARARVRANGRPPPDRRRAHTTPPPGSAAPPRAGANRALRPTGWATLGAGLALAVASGVLGGLAVRERSTVEDADPGVPWHPTIADHDARFRRYRAGAWVCAGIGAAAAVTGAVLLVLGHRRKPTERARARIRITPPLLRGGAGLVFTSPL